MANFKSDTLDVSFTPRIPHEDVVSAHLPGVGGPDLVGRPHPEPVLVLRGEVLHLDGSLGARVGLGDLGPGAIAGGRVQGLDDVLLQLRPAVVFGRIPVEHQVVLEDVGVPDVEGRRRHVHDVDVDVLLVLSLRVPHDDLVDAGLLSLGVDHVELDAVAVHGELNVLADLQYLAVLLDEDLHVGLLLALDLVRDGHVALLLGHAGDGAAVAHLRRLLALDDGEVGLGLHYLVAAVRGSHCCDRTLQIVSSLRVNRSS